MKPIDLSGLPPTVLQIEAETRHLAAMKQLYLLGGCNAAALLALAIGLASENGFDLFMNTAIVVMTGVLVCLANVWLLTGVRLGNLQPATASQVQLVEAAMQYPVVARYMTNVHAQNRELTGREAATIFVHAAQERRRAQSTHRNENEYSL